MKPFCRLALCLLPLYCAAGAPAALAQPPALTGQELLLEAVDEDGLLGIYALDVPADKKAVPRLLVRGGSNPKWSVGHRRFLYLKDQEMHVYELDGKQTVWSADKIAARYSNPARLEQGRIWWDYSGKVNFIEELPASGKQLSRGIGLDEELPLPGEKHPLGGFNDTIIPLGEVAGKPAIESIGNASIAPGEKLLAAQVYPSLPQNMGASQSRIRLYDLFYHLSQTDEKRWLQQQEKNRAYFHIAGTSPQVAGPGREVGSPTPGCIDIEPLFSPSGKYLAFNRIDTRAQTVRPMLVEVARPERAVALDLPPAVDEHASTPEKVWGWPHHRAVQWDSEQDRLWIVSGGERRVYAATPGKDAWQVEPVYGHLYSIGPPSQYAFHQAYFCGVWGGQPGLLSLFKAGGDGNPWLSLDLPEGMSVRRVEW